MPDSTPPESRPKSRIDAVVREVRGHPVAYSVLFTFLLCGPLLAKLIFPEAPLGALVLGGIFLGAYAAFCAVPGEFL